MAPAAPPIGNERAYIEWFAKHSPEFEMIRGWIGGDISKFSSTVADMCSKTLAQANTADKLYNKLVEVSTIYKDRLLPVINEHGGFEKFLAMPPQLIQATIQLLAQLFVFKEILVKKYDHRIGELFAVMDVARPI
jgi:hypothetical protein